MKLPYKTVRVETRTDFIPICVTKTIFGIFFLVSNMVYHVEAAEPIIATHMEVVSDKMSSSGKQPAKLVEEALKSVNLANGITTISVGKIIKMKKVDGVACVRTSSQGGDDIVQNAEGTFIVVDGNTALRLDFIKALQKSAETNMVDDGLPKFNSDAKYTFAGAAPNGIDQVVRAEVSEEILRKQADSLDLAVVKKTMGVDVTREVILQQLPSTSLFTLTPAGRLISIQQFTRGGIPVPLGSLQIDTSAEPPTDEMFKIPPDVRIVPIDTQQKLVNTMRRLKQKSPNAGDSKK